MKIRIIVGDKTITATLIDSDTARDFVSLLVWTPPGVKHWHGATATTAMTHIAVQESFDGKAVEWMEKVSDEQYKAPLDRGINPGKSCKSCQKVRQLKIILMIFPTQFAR